MLPSPKPLQFFPIAPYYYLLVTAAIARRNWIRWTFELVPQLVMVVCVQQITAIVSQPHDISGSDDLSVLFHSVLISLMVGFGNQETIRCSAAISLLYSIRFHTFNGLINSFLIVTSFTTSTSLCGQIFLLRKVFWTRFSSTFRTNSNPFLFLEHCNLPLQPLHAMTVLLRVSILCDHCVCRVRALCIIAVGLTCPLVINMHPIPSP